MEFAFGDSLGPRQSALDRPLNDEQKAAIAAADTGVTKVDALAGSGKTSGVILPRTERLLVDNPNDNALILAFNKRIQQELEEKVRTVMSDRVNKRVKVYNSHSLAWEMVRNNKKLLNLPKETTIETVLWKMIKFLKETMRKEQHEYHRDFQREFLQLEDDQIEAIIAIEETVGKQSTSVDEVLADNWWPTLKDRRNNYKVSSFIIRAMIEWMPVRRRRYGQLMFQDLLPLALELPDKIYANLNFQHILVDEGQDLNEDQHEFAARFYAHARSLTVVGDPNQAIYCWSGAKPALFNDLGDRYPGTIAYPLQTNYRSVQSVLDLGNWILDAGAESPNRLKSPKINPGKCIRLGVTPRTWGEDEEGYAIAEREGVLIEHPVTWIQEKLAQGVHLKDIAVIYRTHVDTITLELELLKANIPYKSKAGGAFQHKVIEDIMAYVRFLTDDPTGLTEKSYEDWWTIVNHMKYLGKKTAEQSWEITRGDPLAHQNLVPEACQNQRMKNLYKEMLSKLNELHRKLSKDSITMVVSYLTDYLSEKVWKNRWASDPQGFKDAEQLASAFLVWADKLCETPLDLVHLVQRVKDWIANSPEDSVTLTTIHQCVHPDTLVETTQGLFPIKDIPNSGIIGTPTGAHEYLDKFTKQKGKALKITTKSGYSLTVSPEHGMTTWDGEKHIRVEAGKLTKGDWLRLKLGTTVDTKQTPKLPAAPTCDSRAIRYHLPEYLSEEFAEFLGLMVADGTIFKGGFRLVKRYQSVVDRFEYLVRTLFEANPTSAPSRGTPGIEVDSTYLAAWLLSIGGLSPNNKKIPSIILQAPLNMQAAFLRGLFEDGTVNEKDDWVDHIHWENVDYDTVGIVQTMLLRFGIISSRTKRVSQKGVCSLYLFGQSAKKFRDQIGFVAVEKNNRLQDSSFAVELNYSVPLSKIEIGFLKSAINIYSYQNGRARGYLSRHTLREAVKQEDPQNLSDRLNWHYERIVSIEEVECETMCVTVPEGSRFLQNGFDGWNSKGLEWEYVVMWMVGTRMPLAIGDPEEERCGFYVAVTRAREELFVSIDASPANLPYEMKRLICPMGHIAVKPGTYLDCDNCPFQLECLGKTLKYGQP